jgi:two-component system, OmpR family, response regulator
VEAACAVERVTSLDEVPLATASVLVIEDDEDLAAALGLALAREGYAVMPCADGARGLESATTGDFDMIILDIMLPSLNGFRICSELRARSIWTPILMLTAKSGEWDQAESLDAGADDYLVKPVSMVVLCAHVRALLRRSQLFDARVMASGGIVLDPVRHTCASSGRSVELSAKEVEVMAFLMKARDAVTKSDLLAGVWGSDFRGDANIAEVYVSHLRKKLEGPFGRRVIETVRGSGYRFIRPKAAEAQ